MKGTVKISTIAENISHIKLETRSNCIIENIKRIDVADNKLFVLDNYKQLLVFNLNGQFLNKIGTRGRGPGEFSKISDFTIDKSAKIVYILDNNEILGFDYQGEFINYSVKVKFINTIYLYNKTFYCYSPEELSFFAKNDKWFKIRIIDMQGEQLNSHLPGNENVKNTLSKFISFCQFYEVDKQLFFFESGSIRVYNVDLKQAIPKYGFGFGKNLRQTDRQEDNIFECKSVLENSNLLIVN